MTAAAHSQLQNVKSHVKAGAGIAFPHVSHFAVFIGFFFLSRLR